MAWKDLSEGVAEIFGELADGQYDAYELRLARRSSRQQERAAERKRQWRDKVRADMRSGKPEAQAIWQGELAYHREWRASVRRAAAAGDTVALSRLAGMRASEIKYRRTHAEMFKARRRERDAASRAAKGAVVSSVSARKLRERAKAGDVEAQARHERRLEYRRQWYADNAERLREESRVKGRKRYPATLEKQRAFESARREKAAAGDEKAKAALARKREQSRAWKKANRERVREYDRARRASGRKGTVNLDVVDGAGERAGEADVGETAALLVGR